MVLCFQKKSDDVETAAREERPIWGICFFCLGSLHRTPNATSHNTSFS